MVPTLPATAAAAPAPAPAPAPAAPGSSGPPQRQSCDRCHKQKLRCTRSKNSEGGVCDRCLSKRTQCVYSFSLPKGRPSLHRPADGSSSGGGSSTESTRLSRPAPKSRTASLLSETLEPPAVSSDAVFADAGANVGASTPMNEAAMHIAHTTAAQPSMLSMLMDTSMDMSSVWPWTDTCSWDEMQLETDWSSNDSGQPGGGPLTSLDIFRDDGAAHEGSDPSSPGRALYPPSPPLTAAHGSGQLKATDAGKDGSIAVGGMGKGNLGVVRGGGDGSRLNMGLEKQDNFASLVTAHLSQLSMRLSSLRYLSHTLAQAAESSSGRQPDHRRIPLFQSTAFESVAAWLADDQCSAIMNAYPSTHLAPEATEPYPSPGSPPKPQSCQGLLRDVFSSSHRLMEILRHLQSSNLAEPTVTGMPSTPTRGGSYQHSPGTLAIIRHLVMACDGLLLEIYAAVLAVLQHDAYPGSLINNMTALGDVRLVLVVQLCSYLIERQQQAVDQCFAPHAAQLNVGGKEALCDAREQLQQRLIKLRQTLGCM